MCRVYYFLTTDTFEYGVHRIRVCVSETDVHMIRVMYTGINVCVKETDVHMIRVMYTGYVFHYNYIRDKEACMPIKVPYAT